MRLGIWRAQFTYNLRFPGQYYQAETGLNYNTYRDYDPMVGKYTESDPIGLRDGINTYAYVRSNQSADMIHQGYWTIRQRLRR